MSAGRFFVDAFGPPNVRKDPSKAHKEQPCSEEERIAALLHIAAGTDLMLSSPTAVRQKLFAVRCVLGEKAEELRQEIESPKSLIAMLRPENRGGHLEQQFLEEMAEAQEVYDAYMRDVAIVAPWLERQDPALYAAAKQAGGTVLGCCGSEAKYNAEIRAWISTIAPAAKRRRVTRKK